MCRGDVEREHAETTGGFVWTGKEERLWVIFSIPQRVTVGAMCRSSFGRPLFISKGLSIRDHQWVSRHIGITWSVNRSTGQMGENIRDTE
jgi:hypothetical protein